MKISFLCLLFTTLTVTVTAVAQLTPKPKPNVLLLAIDDQNDWVHCLGGHPLVQTPHLDALAKRGSVFLNAHCQAPLCNPSRTSLLSGRRPSSTGIYGLAPWFRTVPELKDLVTLPQYFKAQGYQTLTTGKIYHQQGPKQLAGEFDVIGTAGGIGVKPDHKLVGPTPMGNISLVDWGAFPHKDEDKGDYKVASWTIQQLQTAATQPDQPFFLAAGFFLPHVPCYISPEWINRYPDDDSVLPKVLATDREDTPRFSWYLHWRLPEPRLAWLQESHQWRNLVRSYLASTSFVDAQIGRIEAALAETGLLKNTIVVVFGDHGWHLGEKGISGKNTLWERSARVPLIFAGPGVTPAGRCTQPAELLDIYPTLLDLCGLPAKADLEGLSLKPQLADANTTRERPALTMHNPGNHSVRTLTHRYIRYADGSEELYDMVADPNEWKNLAKAAPEAAREIIAKMQPFLPKSDKPHAPGSADRILTYDAVTKEAVWEGKVIPKEGAVPGK